MYNLLLQMREFSHLIQNCDSEYVAVNKVLDAMGTISSSTINLIYKDGEVLYESETKETNEERVCLGQNNAENKKMIDNQLNDQFKNIVETKGNVSFDSYYVKSLGVANATDCICVVAPVAAFGKRMGTLFLYKPKEKFEPDTLILIEHVATLTALVLCHNKEVEEALEARKLESVKSAIATLSYSELEAIIYVFDELDGTEGLLVASKIADKANITRSVIVNALRKFEIAGIIESRSLGMKGTFIKVLNEFLLNELGKLQSIRSKK